MCPKVVIIGTYHRGLDELARTFACLERLGCRILYPISLDFIDTTHPIVRTPHDQDMSLYDLEFLALRGIRDVDFVAVHAPSGYVGLSSAFEIGYATAYRKPVFSTTPLLDEMLDCQVTQIQHWDEALDLLQLHQSTLTPSAF